MSVATSISHYENFPVASILLPPELRAPIAHIYHFARSADDFADEGDAAPGERLAALDRYRKELDRIEMGVATDTPLFRALGDTIRTHSLPMQLFRDLLDAFSQDVVKPRYESYAELLDYSRRSANPVGRLLLHLFGAASPRNLAWSDSICSGLQLTNFWQDVAIDWRKGRIYLPQDEMAHYGVTEAHLASGRCDKAWRALLGFQTSRTRDLLAHGAPLGSALPGRIGLEIRVSVAGGLRILEKLDRTGQDMFRHRPVLRWHDWPILLGRSMFPARVPDVDA